MYLRKNSEIACNPNLTLSIFSYHLVTQSTNLFHYNYDKMLIRYTKTYFWCQNNAWVKYYQTSVVCLIFGWQKWYAFIKSLEKRKDEKRATLEISKCEDLIKTTNFSQIKRKWISIEKWSIYVMTFERLKHICYIWL